MTLLLSLVATGLSLSLVKAASSTGTHSLVHGTGGYDPVQAKAFAALAKLSYCGPGPEAAPPYGKFSVMPKLIARTSKDFCEPAGFRLGKATLVAKAGGSQRNADFAYVAKLKAMSNESAAPADCLVAFRGTWVNPANQKANVNHTAADFVTPSCPQGCKVIGGAYGIWMKMRKGLINALEEVGCPKGASLTFTGHSLGGQVASVAMFALQDQLGYRVRGGYTFEQPRVFNTKAVEAFERLFAREASFFRVTHKNDDVPRFPTRGEWRQPGFQVWYQGPDSYELCGRRERCGVDALPRAALCAMNEKSERCGAGAPFGGPHCSHPLAPAGSFCSMAGNSEDLFSLAAMVTCLVGDPMPAKPMGPTLPPAVWPLTLSDRHLAAAECFKKDTAASPLGMMGAPTSFEKDVGACQRRCGRTVGCGFFTYRGDSGACELTGAWGHYTGGIVGAVAGPRECGMDVVAEYDASMQGEGSQSKGPWLVAGAMLLLALLLAAVISAGRRRRAGGVVLLDLEAQEVE